MAKTYIDTVKYEVTVSFKIGGLVDKHDIVGAVFGQSEGLLGQDLDLRELQKNGKIGRIEINQRTAGGNTLGEVIIPSSMDMVETCILSASIETVDKVGPYKSEFKTIQIEDTRTKKRKFLKDRAIELLRKLIQEQIPESAEIARQVRDEVRTSELVNYGPDKLSAGPAVNESDSLIIVEGRADVLNLLKNNIKNVVGLEGGNIPPSVIELAKKKTVTIFADGDRGGELIIRKLRELTNVDYVARAPAGKEVEELERKEIIMSLRKKIPVSATAQSRPIQVMPIETEIMPAMQMPPRPVFNKMIPHKVFGLRKPMPMRPIIETVESQAIHQTIVPKTIEAIRTRTAIPIKEEKKPALSPEQEKFKDTMKALKGTLKAKLFDNTGKEIGTVNVRDLMKAIEKEKGIHTIVFDGIITKRLVDASEEKGIAFLVGIKSGKIKESEKTKIIVME